MACSYTLRYINLILENYKAYILYCHEQTKLCFISYHISIIPVISTLKVQYQKLIRVIVTGAFVSDGMSVASLVALCVCKTLHIQTAFTGK